MNIRTIQPEDARQFLNLCKKLDKETQFMMLEPGERTTTVEEQQDQLEHLLSRDNQMIFIAEHDGQLAGYLGAYGGEFHRNRHSVYIVIGILQAFMGRGLGTRLFTALEQWACQHSIHRIELTVMAHNEAGIALYRRRGFEIEGVKKHSLLVDCQYVDEYYMARLLEE